MDRYNITNNTESNCHNKCFPEAACNVKENKCVCPHKLDIPTVDEEGYKCPERKVAATSLKIGEHKRTSDSIYTPLETAEIGFSPSMLPPDIKPENSSKKSITSVNTDNLFGGEEKLRIAVIILVSTVLLSAIIFYFKRIIQSRCRKKTKLSKEKTITIQVSHDALSTNRYTSNPQYITANDMSLASSILIISRSSIANLTEIGEGYFGKVYRGQIKKLVNSEEIVETVAVKMLKDSSNKEAEEDFMHEIKIMSSFQHLNILSLLGVCPRERDMAPWMIFEYMPFGDLANVLRNSNNLFWEDIPVLPKLKRDSLISVSTQIADGMDYLASQRFVHRDLACRNCLVGSDLVVKIADFGMSRDVYTCDYYRIGGSRMLPVRWMSPESILYGKFTLESDVWSYGIVLWEIYTYGKQPYFGYSNEEVLKFILDGVLLTRPKNCPTSIWKMMNSCWKVDIKERATFNTIAKNLRSAVKLEYEDLFPSLPRPPAEPIVFDNSSIQIDLGNDELDPLTVEQSSTESENENNIISHDYLQPIL